MTEASHQMTSNELPPGKRKSGSVGRVSQSIMHIIIIMQVLLMIINEIHAMQLQ